MLTEEHKSDSRGGIVISPKASFILGLVGGVLVLCTIGFILLLCVVFRNGGLDLGKGGSPLAAAPSAAAPSAPGAGAPEEEKVGDVKPVSGDDHVRGDKNAAITLIEYSDFECPFCSRFHPSMEQLMSDPDFKGKLRWVYRHYPLSFHAQAAPAANASECASEQGKFWEYADELIKGQGSLSDAFYGQLADKLKLNRSKFDSCYAAKKYQARITADQTSGTAAGVSGTPGTIILGKNGKKSLVPGAVPYSTLKQMVQDAM